MIYRYCSVVYIMTSRLLYPPLARKIPVVLRRLENVRAGQTGDFQSILRFTELLYAWFASVQFVREKE